MKAIHIDIKNSIHKNYTANVHEPVINWVNASGDKMVTQSGDRLIFGRKTGAEHTFSVTVKENNRYDVV